MSDVLDRFLRYVQYDTQSDEQSTTYPSTEKQLVLLRDLAAELRAFGLTDASIDENGYVTAMIPATTGKPNVPTIGFIAHVDTSPEMSGAGVKPIVHRAYDGRDLVLPDDPNAVLRARDIPELADHIGHDIVTASGTTLLGADDKAGVAEIMAAAAYLAAHPEIPHGPVKVAFNPDEEVGRGVIHFPVNAFGAVAAYTVDGTGAGEVQSETFSGAQVRMYIRGRSIHPGLAKGELVNAIKLAAAIIEKLPKDARSPETTEDREGYVHPVVISGDSSEVELRFIVRDFENDLLDEHVEFLGDRPRGCGHRRALLDRGRVAHSVPQHARCPRVAPGDRREPRGGRPPHRHRAEAIVDPRWHRRFSTHRDGPADPEHLHGRPRRPQRARVDLH